MTIYTTKNLIQYIESVNQQKEALSKSTLFDAPVKESLLETYDLQLRIANRTLNQLNKVEPTASPLKLHTLVFGKNPASKTKYFQQFLDKKNSFLKMNVLEYNYSKCYLKDHEIIAIQNVESVAYLKDLVLPDTIQVPGLFDKNTVRNIHAIPMLIGCNFPKEKLTDAILNRCNIIQLD